MMGSTRKIIVLFETDHWHTNDSKNCIGVFTNSAKFKAACRKIIRKDLTIFSEFTEEELKNQIDWNFNFLLEKKQTQGLSTGELLFEEFEPNLINFNRVPL